MTSHPATVGLTKGTDSMGTAAAGARCGLLVIDDVTAGNDDVSSYGDFDDVNEMSDEDRLREETVQVNMPWGLQMMTSYDDYVNSSVMTPGAVTRYYQPTMTSRTAVVDQDRIVNVTPPTSLSPYHHRLQHSPNVCSFSENFWTTSSPSHYAALPSSHSSTLDRRTVRFKFDDICSGNNGSNNNKGADACRMNDDCDDSAESSFPLPPPAPLLSIDRSGKVCCLTYPSSLV
jgi:hypothetical protein